MIYKNQKIGTIEGITIARFGHGDILINSVELDGKKCLTLRNGKKQPIGSKSGDKSKPYNSIDIILSFENVDSLNALQAAIEKLKSELI